MLSSIKGDEYDSTKYSQYHFDYRNETYDESLRKGNPYDCSLVTYRGHSIKSTLIRCHFSPEHSTNNKYIYSGSYDGYYYIWNIDGTLNTKIKVIPTLRISSSTSSTSGWVTHYGTAVRDVSWHPYLPIIAGNYYFYFIYF